MRLNVRDLVCVFDVELAFWLVEVEWGNTLCGWDSHGLLAVEDVLGWCLDSFVALEWVWGEFKE